VSLLLTPHDLSVDEIGAGMTDRGGDDHRPDSEIAVLSGKDIRGHKTETRKQILH
jgi:hypothetical protein